MKIVLSYIASCWVFLEVLYTVSERYSWNIILFDIVLSALVVIGAYLLTRDIIKNVKSVEKGQIRILLADDEPLVRNLVSEKLSGDHKIHIADEVSNGKQALALLKENKYDLVITDIDMPELDGIELSKIIKKEYPDLKVLALTMYTAHDKLKEIVKSGVSGYLDKERLDQELKSAIYSIIHGGSFFSNPALVLFKEALKVPQSLQKSTVKPILEKAF